METGKWKDIWEKRTDRFRKIDMTDKMAVFLELKRIDGFDVVGGIGLDALIKQSADILTRLSKHFEIKSIFDVGCGCGANLYLFRDEGLRIGGMDYSTAQIKIARKIFCDNEVGEKNKTVEELICGEAASLPTDVKYDALISNSVFSYFSGEEYANIVLDKMFKKSNVSIGLIDIHDIDKKQAFINFRRETVENYDERYKDLHKFFYSRDFFKKWAEKNNLEIEFYDSNVEGYWNKEFVFDVYFYKK